MLVIKRVGWLALIGASFLIIGPNAAGATLDIARAMSNSCPEVTHARVLPMQASVGNEIQVSVAAVDSDGDPIDYVWSGTGGSFADPTSKDTIYTCEQAGNHSITVRISDPQPCTVTWTAQVVCVE